MIFQGTQARIAKKNYIFAILQGRPDPCPASGSAHSMRIIVSRTDANNPFSDTVTQIKSNGPKPRRPSFGSNNALPDIIQLAVACWSENPDNRPSFSDVKRKLQTLVK